MSAPAWHEQLAKLFEGGAGEVVNGKRFLPLVTLDSEARCGLGEGAAWVVAPPDGKPSVVFSPATAHLFHEVLERKRRVFEDELEAGAQAAGLPAEVAFAFPALEVVRAVLAHKSSYLTRLCLEWLLPSELREMRAEIREVSKAQNMPVAVKELAERLIVPE